MRNIYILKSIIIKVKLLLILTLFCAFTIQAQTTEHFSDEIDNATSFSEGVLNFNIEGSYLHIENFTGYGYTGSIPDNQYVDNSDALMSSAGVIGSFSNSGSDFYVHELYILPSANGVTTSNAGTIIIRGKLNSSIVFTHTVQSGDINLSSPNNYYTYVNLSSYSTNSIDELEFETTGSLIYLAIDAFQHSAATTATTPTVTTDAASSISITTATLNGTVNANGASTTVTFEYGLTTSYGSSVTADESPATGTSSTSVSYDLTGLSANTTYHYRVVGTNSEGTTNGADQTFTTNPLHASITTQAVSDIAETTATGNGNVTDLGVPNPTQHGFCYNETGSPSLLDSHVDMGAVSLTGAFSTTINFLDPNTTYYLKAYATNTAGTSYGDEVSFTTLPEAATVTTQAVTSVTTTTATGNGNITDLGAPNPTQHGVCWNTAGAPTIVDIKTEEGIVSATGAFTSSMTSLISNTTYYVKAYATNTVETTYGSEVSFTTLTESPSVTTNSATELTAKTVTLNGTVNANNASTTVSFEYGLTIGYGTTVTANESPITGTSDTPVSKGLSGLSPNTTYHYRVVGVNSGGTTNGADLTFTTLSQDPIVTTDAASDIESSGAILNGTVNANDLSTTVTFEYGLTEAYGSTVTADQSPVVGLSDTPVSKVISELNPNTSYHFRVIATNSEGTTNGSDMTFTTNKYSQTITFDALDDKTTNDDDFNPGATSNLNLEISYSSSNEQVATITGGLIHIVGSGTTNITASQAGNDTVYAATPVEQSLTITQSTGIENQHITGIKMFPNPAKDILNISIENLSSQENVKISIIDIKGSVIYFSNMNKSNYKISLSEFSAGLYIVHIITIKETKNLKLIIE